MRVQSEDDQSFAKASVARECEVQNATQVKSPAEIAGGDILIVQSETFKKIAKDEEVLPVEEEVVRAAVVKTCSENANRFQLLRRSVRHGRGSTTRLWNRKEPK